MALLLDHKTIDFLAHHKEMIEPYLATEKESFLFNWSSFFGVLEIKMVFEDFSFCEREDPLFQATISSLLEIQKEEDLFYLYDSLFSSCLQKIYSLPWLQAEALFLKMVEQKQKKKGFWQEKLLDCYENYFLQEGLKKIHQDLVLSLTWDRFCLLSSQLFDFPSKEPLVLQNLARFKDCLIDSYHHIVGQKKSRPSFFRLVNALFYYEVREERIDLHSAFEWQLLTQSFPLLLLDHEISSCSYVDFWVNQEKKIEEVKILTVDSLEIVQAKKALSSWFSQKIGADATWEGMETRVISL